MSRMPWPTILMFFSDSPAPVTKVVMDFWKSAAIFIETAPTATAPVAMPMSATLPTEARLLIELDPARAVESIWPCASAIFALNWVTSAVKRATTGGRRAMCQFLLQTTCCSSPGRLEDRGQSGRRLGKTRCEIWMWRLVVGTADRIRTAEAKLQPAGIDHRRPDAGAVSQHGTHPDRSLDVDRPPVATRKYRGVRLGFALDQRCAPGHCVAGGDVGRFHHPVDGCVKLRDAFPDHAHF